MLLMHQKNELIVVKTMIDQGTLHLVASPVDVVVLQTLRQVIRTKVLFGSRKHTFNCGKMKSSSEYRKNLHQQSYKSIFGINPCLKIIVNQISKNERNDYYMLIFTLIYFHTHKRSSILLQLPQKIYYFSKIVKNYFQIIPV